MQCAGKFYIFHPSRSDKFKIWGIGDLHMMSRAHHAHQLSRDLAVIKEDPFSFWFGMGDYCDFIGYADKRFDPDAVAEDVSIKDLGRLGATGMERVKKAFDPIKKKCFGLIEGNHERKYALHKDQQQLHGWLCTELDLPNFGYSVFFDIVFRRVTGIKTPRIERLSTTATAEGETRASGNEMTVRVFAHHGAGFATTPGGKLNKLIKVMHDFDADLYYMAHVHEPTAKPISYLSADGKCEKLMARKKMGVITGSYLLTYAQDVTTYGEQKLYSPVETGARFATIEPDKQRIKAEV